MHYHGVVAVGFDCIGRNRSDFFLPIEETHIYFGLYGAGWTEHGIVKVEVI